MALQPPATLLMGPSGSGKTTSLASLARAGIKVYVLVTEPTGVDSLLDAWEREKLDINLLHYCVVAPASPGWAALNELSTMVGAMSYKDLSEMKQGIGKASMKQFPKLLQMCQNFINDRDGKAHGDVTELGSDCAFVVDSLSGLSQIIMQHTVGFKPSPHMGEWGIAMSTTENFLLKIASDCKCFFVMTAHIEKEPDEITGMTRIMISTLGKKLAPKIPKYFSEIVRTTKTADGKFTWATVDSESDLKNRALPSSKALPPDFAPIVDAYRKRVALSTKAPTAPAV